MSDPHVSPALKHLRFGVSAAAGLLAITLIAHMLLFGLVHYTDIRVSELTAPNKGDQPFVVVHPSTKSGETSKQESARSDSGPKSASQGPQHKTLTKLPQRETAKETAESETHTAPDQAAHERLAESLPHGNGIDANRVVSPAVRQLQAASAVMQTLGVCAAIALVILLFQGVSIAAGSNVPGVDKAVTASSWALLLAFLALPWHGILPELVYPGVFQSYATIANQSDILRGLAPGETSAFTFYALNIVLPVLMLGGVAAVALRFRIGIERGIIVTHASQLEEQIEREIRERKLGELSTPRAVGALNRAIGLGAGAVEPAPEIVTPRAHEIAGASPMSARGGVEAPRRAI